MKKTLFFLITLTLFSCRTQEVVKIEYVRDSVEVGQIIGELSEKVKEISRLQTSIHTSERRFRDVVEQLQITESEKQALIESHETTIKEYNAEGILTKETYSKRVTDFQKELNSFKSENKALKERLFHEQEMNTVMHQENTELTDQLIESHKKVELLEKQKADSKSVKTHLKWWMAVLLFLLGGVVGFAICHYFKKIKSKLFFHTS